MLFYYSIRVSAVCSIRPDPTYLRRVIFLIHLLFILEMNTFSTVLKAHLHDKEELIMTEPISVFKKNSREYNALTLAAAMLQFKSPNGYAYRVETIYFDYGAGVLWTTVVGDSRPDLPPDDDRRSVIDSWQALSPREQEMILDAESISEMEAAVDGVFEGEYCPDRVKSA